jgi:hypothetical protein
VRKVHTHGKQRRHHWWQRPRQARPRKPPRRLSTETKQFFKTSEFVAYVLAVTAILIAGNAIEAEEGGNDFFTADKVWLYIALLTIGYMLSRGIAKAGVRDPYSDDDNR